MAWGALIGGGLSLAGGLMGGSGAPKFPYSISGERNRMNFGNPSQQALTRGGFNLRRPQTWQDGDFMPLSGIQDQREFAVGQGQQAIGGMQDILNQYGPQLMEAWQNSMYQSGAGGMAPGAQDLVNTAKTNSADVEKWINNAIASATGGVQSAKGAAQAGYDQNIQALSGQIGSQMNARGLGSSTTVGQQVTDSASTQALPALMQAKAMAEMQGAGLSTNANLQGADIMSQRRSQEEGLGMTGLMNDWQRRFDPGRELGYMQTLLGLEQMPNSMQANMFAQPGAMFANPASSAQMAGQGAGTQFAPGSAMGNLSGAMGNVGGNVLNQYLASLFGGGNSQGGTSGAVGGQSGTPGPNPWQGGPTSGMGKPWWQ